MQRERTEEGAEEAKEIKETLRRRQLKYTLTGGPTRIAGSHRAKKKVYPRAKEKHFFLLPPCAVVATTVAFSGKRDFFLAFPWFPHLLSNTYSFPNTGKERLTLASDSCCNVHDNFQQKTQRSRRCRGSCGLVRLAMGMQRPYGYASLPPSCSVTQPNARRS